MVQNCYCCAPALHMYSEGYTYRSVPVLHFVSTNKEGVEVRELSSYTRCSPLASRATHRFMIAAERLSALVAFGLPAGHLLTFFSSAKNFGSFLLLLNLLGVAAQEATNV